jgi:hypothetical protein
MEDSMKNMTPEEILALPMTANDAGAKTIREYLLALLNTLLREEEGFSGKRPFGNSGWIYDLYGAMAKGGVFPATVDEYGDLVDFDEKVAAQELEKAVLAL